MAQVKSIKGTHDILPNQTKDWQELEMQVHKTSNLYGYSEIRTPIIETASLFNRGSEKRLILSQKKCIHGKIKTSQSYH